MRNHVLASLVVVVIASGCSVRHVELSAGVDAGSAPQSVSKPSAYGCGEWLEDQIAALRGSTCEGYCSSSAANAYDIESKPTMMAATAGRWAFCGGHLGPSDAIGVEFVPGCRLFFLRGDASGIAVRGTEDAYQAKFAIFDPRPAGAPAQIDVYLPGFVTATETVEMDVEAFQCPERLRLRHGDDVIDLARFEQVQGGTGDPKVAK